MLTVFTDRDPNEGATVAILSPSPIRSDRLTCSSGLLVAEMSDLGPGFRFGRVWDDACDEGLTVVSVRTGRQVVFAVEHEERDREGELLFIDLLPADRRVQREFPSLRVRLFND